MHKNVFALLCAALVLAGMTTACAKHSKYGQVYVDERGMEHILATDKNGETIVNGAGELVEVMTDSSGKPFPAVTENGTTSPKQEGEYQTGAVTFPGVLVDEKKAEDQYCTVDVPDGWSADSDSGKITLTQKKTGAQVVVQPNVAVTSASAIDKIIEDCKMGGVEYTEDSGEVDGLPAKVVRYTTFGTDFTAYAVNNAVGSASTVICMTSEGKADKTDFSEVLQNIHFK